jgi:NADH:ubiquinone oxidoreductase subunit
MGVFKFLTSILGVSSPIHINWVRFTSGSKFVGVDGGGNKYYRAKARKGYKHERRWVMYNGVAEATKVPPEWHGWLHHQSDVFPCLDDENASYRRPWQKGHTENKTGTDATYLPPGHQLKGGQRDKASGDYEAWTPPQ